MTEEHPLAENTLLEWLMSVAGKLVIYLTAVALDDKGRLLCSVHTQSLHALWCTHIVSSSRLLT